MSAGAAAMTRAFGRKAKNHDGMSSDEWCSPYEVAVPLFHFWGYADGDPCSNDRSVIRARKRYTFGGLTRPWWKKTYDNHPYSQNDEWAKKAIHEMRIGNVVELVILCMTSASTIWWQSLMVKPKVNPRVICTKRLPFLGPDGKPGESSRFDPALIYYGKRHAAFDREFRSITRWSTWGR